jgi:hypothetical protein
MNDLATRVAVKGHPFRQDWNLMIAKVLEIFINRRVDLPRLQTSRPMLSVSAGGIRL